MKNRERIARGLVVIGSLSLFAPAALRDFTGYPMLSRALGTVNPRPFLEGSSRAFWHLLSWHWVVIGVLALVVSYGGTKLRKFAVLLCGLLAFMDAIGTIIAVGLFLGNELLILAALAFLAAAVLFEDGHSLQA
ncbi:MAG TPA: hypothetical protein VGR03_12825 [Candidatus Acidoferrum sp.]|nr:hypothetical protein [Candidatus Acidoferrum sp.]